MWRILSGLRCFGDKIFIEATQTEPLCATSAAVSSFIQSTRSSGKRCSRLFINALNETGGNLSQAAEGLRMSLLDLKKAIKRLGIG